MEKRKRERETKEWWNEENRDQQINPDQNEKVVKHKIELKKLEN